MRIGAAQLIVQMRAAERRDLLALLASAIVEMTILSRSSYEEDAALSRLRETNEAIHRLAGHLRDLCDTDEILSENRSAGIGEDLQLLNSASIARLSSLTV